MHFNAHRQTGQNVTTVLVQGLATEQWSFIHAQPRILTPSDYVTLSDPSNRDLGLPKAAAILCLSQHFAKRQCLGEMMSRSFNVTRWEGAARGQRHAENPQLLFRIKRLSCGIHHKCRSACFEFL